MITRKINVNNINLQINNVDFWGSHVGNKGGMRVYWSADIGFGQLDIVKRSGNDGEGRDILEGALEEELILIVDTECMDFKDDKVFTEKIMSLLVEKLKVIG
jgi:hypothetical protein